MAGVKSLLHERLQLQTPEKAAAAFYRLCCYRCKLKVFERAQHHAVQMEWIQEILTLKGENSSKIELGGTNRILNRRRLKTTIILQKDLFTSFCDHSVLPLSSLYRKSVSSGILMESLNTALTNDSVVIFLCVL